MKLAVLSNINMDPLKPLLEKQGFPSSYFCGYGQYMQELVHSSSKLNNEHYDVVLIHLDGEELLKDSYYSLSESSTSSGILSGLINSLEDKASTSNDTLFILSTIVFPPYSFLTYLEANSNTSFNKSEKAVNLDIQALSSKHKNMLTSDFERLVKLHGYEKMYDEKYWYLGRIKYNNFCFEVIAADIRNLVNAYLGRSKKALVLDLDNTIWGGVIGEDGPSGIKISEDGVGKSYRDFQRTIRALKEIGVLLAINSKNNEADVQELFYNNRMMILKYDDFIIKKINWNNKVSNMKDIASELNLGLDSLVFIDDNPVERQLVRENLPGIAVPDFPSDPALLKTWMIRDIVYNFFPKVRLTEEDQKKFDQYKSNILRNERKESLVIDGFIKSLDINLTIAINDKAQVQRLAQLTQKTNQFNMTTKRYSEIDVIAFLNSKDHIVFSVDYKDKFGHEGIIGMAINRLAEKTAEIDTFLLSCRVIGRNIEFVLLNKMMTLLNKRGIHDVVAEFISTKKNDIAKAFYAECGMVLTKGKYKGKPSDIIEKTLNKAEGIKVKLS